MRIRGIDFTSTPSRSKPITCAECRLSESELFLETIYSFETLAELEIALGEPGPWICGIDFPFGLSRRFIENMEWPANWSSYVTKIGCLSRPAFRTVLDEYKKDRPAGDKEHRRKTDISASSMSPQKQYGVPVALMFHEGAPRLLRTGVFVPVLRETGDRSRIVVEAYPGVRARSSIGRISYKNDQKKKQTADQAIARLRIFESLSEQPFIDVFGFNVVADASICDDPTGDRLDALICAVQAAWAWGLRDKNFGIPLNADPLEGWICDPSVSG